MSVFKKKNALACAEFNGFEGIDRSTPLGKIPSAHDIVNFRVLPDDSLEKRPGFKFAFSLPDAPRKIWSGVIQQKEYIYAVCGSSVYCLHEDSTVPKKLSGELRSSNGRCSLVYFGGGLYVFDGSGIYSISTQDDTLTESEGYVPLIGKDWPCTYLGEEYEPPNYATRHVRISYALNGEPSMFLCTRYPVESIDAVYINGELVTDTSRYYYHERLVCVCIPGLEAFDEVMLYLTLSPKAFDNQRLTSCIGSAIYGGLTNCRLFLWNGSRPDLMFGSKDSDRGSLEQIRQIYPLAGTLYFPISSSIQIGQGDSVIQGISRQYDRMLIFTDKETWMSNSVELSYEDPGAMTINYSYGCSSDNACIVCQNEPISVSEGSILRWTAQTDELNECNAYSISTEIEPLLSESFYKNAIVCFDKNNEEVLFSDRSSDEDTVWVYNIRSREWYIFTGICAEQFVSYDNRIGFVNGRSVYFFDPDLKHDVLDDGSHRQISAHYVSHSTDLGVRTTSKRLCGFELYGDLDGGEIEVELSEKGSPICSLTLKSDGTGGKHFKSRITSGRFERVYMTVRADGAARQRIHNACISVKA